MGRIRSVAPVPFVSAALFLAIASSDDPTGPESPPAEITELPRSLTLAETEALQAANDFGLDLLRRLYEEGEEDRDATLADLVEEMDGERWQEVVDALRGEARTEVRLPRFELTYERVLNDVLKAMGMEVAFDRRRADFGWLLGNAGLDIVSHIGWMKQKSFVKVDEEGTETAAATGTAFAVSGTPILQADRPFLFAIRERLSGTILFVGTVSDPTS